MRRWKLNWPLPRSRARGARTSPNTFAGGGARLNAGGSPSYPEVVVFVVVCYDVVDDRTRTRLAKLMQNYGNRVQKSVFECTVD
ncbi:MAG: CRISPR-associated endonuclease Cas2, partial [Thermodesulfobacteriota bacterium]